MYGKFVNILYDHNKNMHVFLLIAGKYGNCQHKPFFIFQCPTKEGSVEK